MQQHRRQPSPFQSNKGGQFSVRETQVEFTIFVFPRDRLYTSQSKDICFKVHMVIFPSWEQQILTNIKTVDTFKSRPRGAHCLDATDSCNERKWPLSFIISLYLLYSYWPILDNTWSSNHVELPVALIWTPEIRFQTFARKQCPADINNKTDNY